MIGKTFGRLTVISEDPDRKNGKHKYYLCKCTCGNIKSVRSDGLKCGDNQSCGCLNREKAVSQNKSRAVDLTGQTINNLEVLEYDHSDIYRYYKCKCNLCGKTVVLPSNLIKRYGSCGCRRAEALKISQAENARKNKRMMTQPGLINKKEANSNSQTGVRGVFYRRSSGKYEAVITFRKKRKFLGRYSTLEEAAEARKKAEIIRADALRDLIDFEAEIEKEMGLKGLSE